MDDKIQVVIVDDHSLVREGVASILEANPDFNVVGQGSSNEEAILLSRNLQPNLVLLDIDMAGGNLATAQSISVQCPITRIIFLTISEAGESSIKRLRPSGCAYILKDLDTLDLVSILKAVSGGESILPRALATCLLCEYSRLQTARSTSNNPLLKLTLLEHKILEYLSTSLSCQEIGQRLFLTEDQIKQIVSGILVRLKVRDRVEPAIYPPKKHSRALQDAYLAIELGKR